MSSLMEVQNLIGAWGDKTFPDSTAETVLSHLQEEINELVEANVDYEKNNKDRIQEAADCFLLVMQYAHKMGYDILYEAIEKMKINIARDWNTIAEPGGHFKHNKES